MYMYIASVFTVVKLQDFKRVITAQPVTKGIALLLIAGLPFSIFGFELRTVAQDSAPKFFMVEENGKPIMKGLCIEIMQAIENLDPDINFTGKQHFLPTGRAGPGAFYWKAL